MVIEKEDEAKVNTSQIKSLEKVLDKAKSYDLSKDEIRDLFDILMEE